MGRAILIPGALMSRMAVLAWQVATLLVVPLVHLSDAQVVEINNVSTVTLRHPGLKDAAPPRAKGRAPAMSLCGAGVSHALVWMGGEGGGTRIVLEA